MKTKDLKKAVREKQHYNYRRKTKNRIFHQLPRSQKKVLKEPSIQNAYLAKISFRNEKKTKKLSDAENLRELVASCQL